MDGKYETNGGWEGAPAQGITVLSASENQYVISVASGFTLSAVCVKTGNGENVAGDFAIVPGLPVTGPAAVTITRTGGSASGLSHVTFDTTATAPPPPPPPPPGPPAPPAPPPPGGGGVFTPPQASVCVELAATRRIALRVGVRTTARLRVVDQRGRAMARVRVIARGPGIRTGARTNANGVVALSIRPRSAGVVRFSVPGSTRCVLRLGITARFRPPVLTG